MIKRMLAILMLLGMLGSIAGCNTIEGMGKDIERGGEVTQDVARDTKDRM
jgi:entericidin B